MNLYIRTIAKTLLPKYVRRLLRVLFGYAVYLASCQWVVDIPELFRFYHNGSTDVLFYLLMPVHEEWITTTFARVSKNMRCRIVLHRNNATADNLKSTKYYCVSTFALKYFHAPIIVTPASGIPRSWLSPRCFHVVHMPHSLVSLHMVYPPDQFDGYDYFFCCGDHHVREIQAIWEKRGLKGRQLRKIGYGRLDLLKEQFDDYNSGKNKKTESDVPVILIAPSWGIKNILTEMGTELINLLIGAGFKVILRPHPLLIKSPVLKKTIEFFKSTDVFCIEDSNKGNQAIFVADLLITDYSGIAHEYAFLREKPVLFVDVPKKIYNLDWQQFETLPIELSLREKLGIIVDANAEDAYRAAIKLLASPHSFIEEIQRLRVNHVYNFGFCAKAAGEELSLLLDKVKT
jgi:hypothetical protein